jgi:septal ring factor EnvC (AmiA/AmiB activator)
MKYASLILLLLLGSFSLAQAQLNKAEKKALKKEIKDLSKNPEKYKALKEGIQEKKEELIRLEADVDDVEASMKDVQAKINEKNAEEKRLIDEIARLSLEKKQTQSVISNQTNLDGLVYKVQVEINDAALYQEISEIDGEKRPVFTGDEDEDGIKKYTLGYFKERKEAETFRDYLKLLRIKDAKIVPYRDGKKTIE